MVPLAIFGILSLLEIDFHYWLVLLSLLMFIAGISAHGTVIETVHTHTHTDTQHTQHTQHTHTGR